MCISATAYDEELVILSELSDEELLAFLEDSGVEVPEVYNIPEEYLPFVRHIIEGVEEKPDAFFGFGYGFLTYFAEEIKVAVLDHYGPYLISTYVEQTSSSNILTENTPVFPWKYSYGGYNCYAYAIGREEYTEPGWVAEGKSVDDGYEDSVYETIIDFLDGIEDDLESMNYVVTYSGTQYDSTYIVNEHKRMICARFQYDEVGGDFHFMVKEEDGYWYNKYSGTIPMRYHYTLSSGNAWTYEGYKKVTENGVTREIYFRDPDIQYSGTIFYITYTIPCINQRFMPCGDDSHIMTCVTCGKTTGSVVACSGHTYMHCGMQNGISMHALTCPTCGDTTGGVLPCIYKNNRCTTCGSIKPNIIQSISPGSMATE